MEALALKRLLNVVVSCFLIASEGLRVIGSGRQNEKATASRKRLRKDKECNRVQKAEDIAEYKGSWPVEKLVDYINNSHLKQLSRLTDAIDATVELANGDLKDRSRKAKKKPSRKEPSSSEAQSNIEQSNSRPGLELPEQRLESEDALEAPENIAPEDGPLDICLEQLEEAIFRSKRNGENAHSLSPFVMPESSSSSDLAEFMFFDDFPATPKEEEFKVVQRKKKTKANQIQDEIHFAADRNNRKRMSKLEKCKEFIEKQVVVSKVAESILKNGLKNVDSFSNSVSVSTFASLSSSVRSSSPVNTTDIDECSMMCEPPMTTADIVGVSNDENADCCIIPGVTLCATLGNELDNRRMRAVSPDERVVYDLVLSDKNATAKVSFCHLANGRYASHQLNGLFVSDAGYPDIVTSTISEFPVSKSIEAVRQIPDVEPNVSLPQPGDIAEPSVNYSCVTESGSSLSNAESRSTHQSKDAFVFGDFSSSELKAQDKSYCDTNSAARQINLEFPMSYSRLRSSRRQMRAKPRHEKVALEFKDSGMCSNPVVFVNCVAEAVCDPEISFGFDSCEDEEEYDILVSRGSNTIGLSAGGSKRGVCLPDLVDPAVVQRGSSHVIAEPASSTAICTDVCDAEQFNRVQSLKSDSKSSLMIGVDCHACILSASSDSSTFVPDNIEVASSWSDVRLPTKACNAVTKTLEKFCISSKWNRNTETACAKRNERATEGCNGKRGGYRMKENASHGHSTTCSSEKPQKKLTTINNWIRRTGEFDLCAAQAFLWTSFQETLEEQGCVYLQCD